jgi:hypothetical protein
MPERKKKAAEEGPMTGDERREFRDGLSAPHQRALDDMIAALPAIKQRSGGLAAYHMLGRGARTLCAGRDKEAMYGWMKMIHRAMGCSPALLVKARDFAGKYSTREVKELEKEKITWGLVYPTLWVKDKEKRKKWMIDARAGNWTVQELAARIQETQGGPKREGGRKRRPKKGTDLAIDLTGLRRACERWVDTHKNVWAADAGPLPRLDELPPGRLRALLKKIEEAEQAVGVLLREATALEARLKALREKAVRARAAR